MLGMILSNFADDVNEYIDEVTTQPVSNYPHLISVLGCSSSRIEKKRW